MNSLSEIAMKIKGKQCEKLVKQTGTEVAVSGTEFGVSAFKINIGDLSTKIKEFYKVPQIMVALDTSQYLLCAATKETDSSPSLREDCKRIRIQLILAFSNLQGLLAVEMPNADLSKEIVRWIRFMTKLHKESIELLRPAPRMIKKGGKSPLAEISKYQGIEEEQMTVALSILQ